MRRTLAIPGTALALLSILALAGCERSGANAAGHATAAPAPTVQVVKARRGELVRSLTLPGQVRAYQETTLYAKVAGYLKSIAVDRGDRVLTGDVIAEIEAPEMLADRTKLKAELEVARVEFQRVTEARTKAPDLVIPQTVDETQGKLAVAKARLERLETLLGFATVSAPFTGIVTKRWVDPGAFIPSATGSSAARNAAIVTISDFSRVRVEVAVPEPEVSRIRKDLPVRVRADGLPGRAFEGSITRFAYGLDELTKTMATEIEIANPDLALRPGMMASVRVDIERKPDALLLPGEALMSVKNENYVFAYRDGKAMRMAVTIGFDDGVSVEILEGVQPGDAVILAGQHAVTDGQLVKATEAR